MNPISTPVTYVGSQYNVPAYQDTGYAQGAGNLSSYLIALATGSLTLSGGTFTLTSDVNFGSNFGLLSKYFQALNGTAAAPSFTFSTDTHTGFYRVGANEIGISTGGSQQWGINSAGSFYSAAGNTTGRMVIPDGAVGSPGLQFTTDTDSGIYRIASNNLGMALGGSKIFDFSVTGIGVGVNALAPFHAQVANSTSTAYLKLTKTGVVTWTLQTGSGNDLVLVSDGAGNFYFSTNISQLASNDGSAGSPFYSFGSDLDNGLYRIGTNNPALSAGGTKVIDMKTSGVAVLGTNTNDNAATGFYGETQSSPQTTETGFPATTQYGDLVSVPLTAGDWLVSACLKFTLNGATVTSWSMGISITNGNSSAGLSDGDTNLVINPAATNQSVSLPFVRLSLSGSANAYLKYRAIYSAGTPNGQGRITAMRIR